MTQRENGVLSYLCKNTNLCVSNPRLTSKVNLVTLGMDSAVRIQTWTPAARNVRVGTIAMPVASRVDLMSWGSSVPGGSLDGDPWDNMSVVVCEALICWQQSKACRCDLLCPDS